jgi:serine-type D-Ala-D-Ala carboxypeptidase
MTSDFFTRDLKSLIKRGREARVFSEAEAAWISRQTHISTSTGLSETPSTLCFDLASLTKLFTAAACLRLAEQGIIDIGAPLSTYLPELGSQTSGRATLEQALRHQAGFAAWHPFFEQIPVAERGSAAAEHIIIEHVFNHPPEALPGEKTEYSDLGYIILPRLIERVTGKGFPDIIQKEIASPLNLKTIHFRPIKAVFPNEDAHIAPTEFCPWRGRILVGEVHDDNAWTMGGVAGHAGLFGSAEDVAKFGAAWLEALEGSDWLSRETANAAIRRPSAGRGIGWDFKTPGNSSAGKHISDNAFGHLGFTGCSLWVDPDRALSVALLTNRVCFGRDNIQIRTFRSAFHDLLVQQLTP